MDDKLAAFLDSLTPFAEQTVTWPTANLRLACFLTDKTTPRRFVTSARAVVSNGDSVLVVQDPNGRHIMPGGRLQPHETPEDALQREVLEETGWSLERFRPIGILHFTHIDPVPDSVSCQYPEFLQIVYAASADSYHPESKELDGYELGSEFLSAADARSLSLDIGQQVFLDAALGQSF